jgi:hypothetical protein
MSTQAKETMQINGRTVKGLKDWSNTKKRKTGLVWMGCGQRSFDFDLLSADLSHLEKMTEVIMHQSDDR